MFRLSTPIIVSTVSFTIMQFVDRFMVSRLGTDALGAVLPAAFASMLPSGFALGAMTSLNTFVSQSFGRGHRAACSSYFWQMIYMGLVYCLVSAAILWPAAPLIFKIMGQPTGMAEMEVIYFRIMLYAHVAAVGNWASNQFFIGIHRPLVTTISAICGQVVNIVASYILIFGKLGSPAMGIAGAGWGTLIGISVSALINLTVFLSRPMDQAFGSRRTLSPDPAKMRDLLVVGVPAGVGLVVNVALWGILLSALVGRFGKEALAATSAVLSYTSLSAMPVIGIATALTAAVGKAIGAGRKDLAIRQTRLCLTMGMIYMGLVGVCFFFLRDLLMVRWSQDPEVIATGSRILICAALYQVFHAARIIYIGALRGAGDTMWPAAISGMGSIIILGFGGVLVARLAPSFGAMGPWIVATLSIMAVGIATGWRFTHGQWMAIDLFKHRAATVPAPA
jgi:MATE family multidrug resistance protein